MAITRTAWIDDDGSGTTGTVLNNAVKTELYNQIDAADATKATVVNGNWTPVDASGSGLTFGSPSGLFTKIDRIVCVEFALVYPVNAFNVVATIGGLPYANGGAQGALTTVYTDYGAGLVIFIAAGTTTISFYTTAAVGINNSNLSGKVVRAIGMYFT